MALINEGKLRRDAVASREYIVGRIPLSAFVARLRSMGHAPRYVRGLDPKAISPEVTAQVGQWVKLITQDWQRLWLRKTSSDWEVSRVYPSAGRGQGGQWEVESADRGSKPRTPSR